MLSSDQFYFSHRVKTIKFLWKSGLYESAIWVNSGNFVHLILEIATKHLEKVIKSMLFHK